MRNLELARVGDKLWSPKYGWGTFIIERCDNCLYYICVHFEEKDMMLSYNADGRILYGDVEPSLFFDIPEFYKKEEYPKRKNWRANIEGQYYLVNALGDIDCDIEKLYEIDNKRYLVGNYFKTEQEARESKLYNSYTR